MYEFIRGKLISKLATRAVIESNGVGYRLQIPLSTYEKLPSGGEAMLLTYLSVREDGMTLFGFATPEERELFEVLLSVSGIGPSTALGVLSSCPVEDFRRAVLREDIRQLQQIRGIGKKTAQRLIFELKGVLPQMQPPAEEDERLRTADNVRDAAAALVNLGYPQKDAEKGAAAAAQRLSPTAPVAELVKNALKHR